MKEHIWALSSDNQTKLRNKNNFPSHPKKKKKMSQYLNFNYGKKHYQWNAKTLKMLIHHAVSISKTENIKDSSFNYQIASKFKNLHH